MNEIKLKPCPFCRCDDRRVGIRRMGSKGYRIVCGRCGSMGPQINIIDNDKMGAQKMAAEAWNRRAGEQNGKLKITQCVKDNSTGGGEEND